MPSGSDRAAFLLPRRALPVCEDLRMLIDVALVPSEARVDGAVLVIVDQIRASTMLTTLLDLWPKTTRRMPARSKPANAPDSHGSWNQSPRIRRCASVARPRSLGSHHGGRPACTKRTSRQRIAWGTRPSTRTGRPSAIPTLAGRPRDPPPRRAGSRTTRASRRRHSAARRRGTRAGRPATGAAGARGCRAQGAPARPPVQPPGAGGAAGRPSPGCRGRDRFSRRSR